MDLIVNCFERTYRDVLAAGFFDSVAEQNRFRFARRVALISNVQNANEAERLAMARVRDGEIDAVRSVAEQLPSALRVTALSVRDLGAGARHSAPSLVAVSLAGPPWVMHWDAEIRLGEPADWIGPGLRAMTGNSRILVASPRWLSPKLEAEVLRPTGEFDLAYGFSDHVYLGLRSELARPIYSERCIVRRRYPLAHRGYTFEARIDAYMRHHGRVRALHRTIGYEHDERTAGDTYPELTFAERARLLANRALIAGVRLSPVRPACCRTMARRDPVKVAA